MAEIPTEFGQEIKSGFLFKQSGKIQRIILENFLFLKDVIFHFFHFKLKTNQKSE